MVLEQRHSHGQRARSETEGALDELGFRRRCRLRERTPQPDPCATRCVRSRPCGASAVFAARWTRCCSTRCGAVGRRGTRWSAPGRALRCTSIALPDSAPASPAHSDPRRADATERAPSSQVHEATASSDWPHQFRWRTTTRPQRGAGTIPSRSALTRQSQLTKAVRRISALLRSRQQGVW